jgi:hypothetical protein
MARNERSQCLPLTPNVSGCLLLACGPNVAPISQSQFGPYEQS